ncbi:MAG: hypothetical protein HZA84_08655 [Thaumarchaeota archaeon]|nr:hypothetical protein [Nitrososphaerota archaeon]
MVWELQNSRQLRNHQFTVIGANNSTIIYATLICKPVNGVKILDPVLSVKSPTGITKFDDDSYTAGCNHFFSSKVLFSSGEVSNGIWDAWASGYQGLGDEVGPYRLDVYLSGAGSLKRGGVHIPPSVKQGAQIVAVYVEIYEGATSWDIRQLNDKVEKFRCILGVYALKQCLLEHAKDAALEDALEGLKKENMRIANDPPRTDYMYKFSLPSPSNIQPNNNSLLEQQRAEFLNALMDSKILLDAYVTSVERFQGAMIDGESEYVVIQSQEVQKYLGLLNENQNRLSNITNSLHMYLIEHESEINSSLLTYQEQLLSNGFSTEEITALQNAGYTTQGIDELKTTILALNSQNTTKLIQSLGNLTSGITEYDQTMGEHRLAVEIFVNDQHSPIQPNGQASGQVIITGTCGLTFPDGNSVNYGSLIPNSISPQVTLNMTNTGTVPATLQVSGSDWLDGSSNPQMFVNRTHYNVTSGTYVQKSPLQSFDQILTNSFNPATILETFWQLQAILMNPSFIGTTTQTMDFTTIC